MLHSSKKLLFLKSNNSGKPQKGMNLIDEFTVTLECDLATGGQPCGQVVGTPTAWPQGYAPAAKKARCAWMYILLSYLRICINKDMSILK